MTMWMYAVMSKSTGCLYGEWEAESPDVAAARCLDYYGTRRDRPSREDMDIIPMSRTKPGPKPGPPGSQRTARLVVRVTPADVEAYKAAAGRAGVSMGELVRQRMAPEPAPWVPFEGTAHPLPPQRRVVLVRMSTDPAYSRGAVVVGYMKFAAGDRSCPYFVTPSAAHGDAIAWCDCLPEAMQAMGPHWPWELPAAAEKEHGG